MDIKKGNQLILLLTGELDPFMHRVEAIIELHCGVAPWGVTATKARAAGCWWCVDDTPTVIHVDEYVPRDDEEALFGCLNGAFHCVCHPYLGDGDH